MVAGMNCFPCFTCQKDKENQSPREHGAASQDQNVGAKAPDTKKHKAEDTQQIDASMINAKHYTFRELATATKNFRQECLLYEGGFGRVYKGIIPATGQVVAVKQLDRNGMNGTKEFLQEVYTLSGLHHDNLVNLIGYCADGDQRLLVYEFFQGKTLEDHLLGVNEEKPPLDWFTRMKVAAGAARGLEYLHDSANPPVIFRDLKPSDILLDAQQNTKLFDFGLNHGGTAGDKITGAAPMVMGTFGYSAPEYVRTGHLTFKSDVYSFGVVLLELITGRRAVDTTRPNQEQNLVSWAQPLFRDPKRYPDMADPNLNNNFPEKDLNQAVAIAAMCLQEEAEARPLMADVVTALSFLSTVPPATPTAEAPAPPPPDAAPSKKEEEGDSGSESGSESESESEYSYYSKRSGSSTSYSASEGGSFSSYSSKASSKHPADDGGVSQKKKSSSRKASSKEMKSSKKSSIRKMGEKISSMKASVRIMSGHHKSSKERGGDCAGGSALSRNTSDGVSQGNISFGLISTGSTQSEQDLSRSSSSSTSHGNNSVHITGATTES